MIEELNTVELALKEIYDGWEKGLEIEKDSKYSSMFRMGFPDEFIHSEKPLLMYVGQECRDCLPYKDQIWARKYQLVQLNKKTIDGFPEKITNYPFWRFYRKLSAIGYNVVWNNLDKFHRNPFDEDHHKIMSNSAQPLPIEMAIALSKSNSDDGLSILQKEIIVTKPKAVVFSIGNKRKYLESLAAALGCKYSDICNYAPAMKEPLTEITKLSPSLGCCLLLTYHAKPLQLHKIMDKVVDDIKAKIK